MTTTAPTIRRRMPELAGLRAAPGRVADSRSNESRQHAFRRGAAAMLSLLPGYAAFGFTVGVAVGASSSPGTAWTGVWLVFSGSAHLTAIQLVDSGAGVAVAALSALLVNLRLGLYSASLAPHWQGTRLRSRLIAAATIVDPIWMLATPQFADRPGTGTTDDVDAAGRRYYAGASVVLWFGWAAMVSVGSVAGSVIPPAAGLDLLPALFLMALVLPRVRSWPAATCMAAAAAIAVVGSGLPKGVPLLLAMPAGVMAAVVVARTRRKG